MNNNSIADINRNSGTVKSYTEHNTHAHQEIFEQSTRLHEREILLLPICIVAVLENFVVCLLICYYRELRTATNIFIFGLCLTNGLFAGVLLPMHCFQKTTEAYLYLTIIIILVYICNLAAVTFERFVAITRPLRYITIITKKRALRITIACYILPTIYCLLPMAWKAEQGTVVHKVYITLTLIVFLIVPLIFILLVYAKVYHETHKFFRKHRNLFNNEHSKGRSKLWEEAKFVCCFYKQDINDENSMSEYLNVSTSDISVSEHEQLFPCVSSNMTNTFPTANGLQKNESDVFDKNMHNYLNENCKFLEQNNIGRSSPAPLPQSSMKEVKDGQFILPSINEDCKDIYQPSGGVVTNNKLPNLSYTYRVQETKKFPVRSSYSFDDAKIHNSNSSSKENGKNRKLSVYSIKRIQLRRSSKKTMQQSTAMISFHKKAKQKLTELKASLAFAMVSLTYMFTWLPVVYMTFLEVIDRLEELPYWLTVVSIYTIGLNAMIDPLLYGFLLRGFRRAIKKTFRNRRR